MAAPAASAGGVADAAARNRRLPAAANKGSALVSLLAAAVGMSAQFPPPNLLPCPHPTILVHNTVQKVASLCLPHFANRTATATDHTP